MGGVGGGDEIGSGGDPLGKGGGERGGGSGGGEAVRRVDGVGDVSKARSTQGAEELGGWGGEAGEEDEEDEEGEEGEEDGEDEEEGGEGDGGASEGPSTIASLRASWRMGVAGLKDLKLKELRVADLKDAVKEAAADAIKQVHVPVVPWLSVHQEVHLLDRICWRVGGCELPLNAWASLPTGMAKSYAATRHTWCHVVSRGVMWCCRMESAHREAQMGRLTGRCQARGADGPTGSLA